MIASGVSFRRSVSPGWPFCPPGFLPDGSRKLLTRGGFLSPSLDGGLPLLLLFSPRRRSNSAICARNAAISAACPACCASSSAMRSSFESWSRAVRSTDSFESTRRSHVNRILHPCPASRHNTRTPACDRVSWTVGLGTWAVTHDLLPSGPVLLRLRLPRPRFMEASGDRTTRLAPVTFRIEPNAVCRQGSAPPPAWQRGARPQGRLPAPV